MNVEKLQETINNHKKWQALRRVEIVCPNCGKIEEYGQKEVVERTLIFNTEGCTGSTEDVTLRVGIPRCLKCGRKIKFN